LRRQHLLPADQRSQTTQSTDHGTQPRCCQLIPRACKTKRAEGDLPSGSAISPSVQNLFLRRDSAAPFR
jgi:hypothetical protein